MGQTASVSYISTVQRPVGEDPRGLNWEREMIRSFKGESTQCKEALCQSSTTCRVYTRLMQHAKTAIALCRLG